MKRKIAPVIFVFSLALNLAVLGVWGAQAIRGEDEPGNEVLKDCSRECRLHEVIGTSAQERAALEPLLAEFRTQRCAICRRLDGSRVALIDAIAAPGPDMERIRRLQDEILEGQRAMQNLIVDQLLKEKQLLSSEQQKRLFGVFRQHCGKVGPTGAAGNTRQGACPYDDGGS